MVPGSIRILPLPRERLVKEARFGRGVALVPSPFVGESSSALHEGATPLLLVGAPGIMVDDVFRGAGFIFELPPVARLPGHVQFDAGTGRYSNSTTMAGNADAGISKGQYEAIVFPAPDMITGVRAQTHLNRMAGVRTHNGTAGTTAEKSSERYVGS